MNQQKQAAAEKMDKLGAQGIPYLFIIDFDMVRPIVLPLSEISPSEILYDIEGISNAPEIKPAAADTGLKKHPVPFGRYRKAFKEVQKELCYGNSYLLNLTFPTAIESSLTPREIFYVAGARFRLWFRNVVVFSPERFVQTKGNVIYSFPMKGTIDAAIPGAEEIILNDPKERAEHNTIVDLIRNDLSIVAENVRVESFRYVEQIETTSGRLLQVSSRIAGDLPEGCRGKLGSIIFSMLPAGSVTGAPKEKTVEIIKRTEGYDRGYYTGVFGLFDGKELNSAVMIRYIEDTAEGLVYKSGGGITIHSDCRKEYDELIRKVYVPVI